MNNDEKFMLEAIKEANKAIKADEVPIGAIVVCDNKIIARAHNKKEKKQIPTSHAEMEVITKACKKINSRYLHNCTIYVTLEPCPMCAGALIMSRIDRVVFGAYDPKGGALESCFKMYEINGFNHYPQVTGGILENKCSEILKAYFKSKRKSFKAIQNMVK